MSCKHTSQAAIERLTRERDTAIAKLAMMTEIGDDLVEQESTQRHGRWAAEAHTAVAEAQRDEALALLRECEHVWLPGMPARDRRCPSCRSPLDLSQPHEAWCRLAKALRGGA